MTIAAKRPVTSENALGSDDHVQRKSKTVCDVVALMKNRRASQIVSAPNLLVEWLLSNARRYHKIKYAAGARTIVPAQRTHDLLFNGFILAGRLIQRISACRMYRTYAL